jgi:alpha-tubulin suppressor-like RCC1 family protein
MTNRRTLSWAVSTLAFVLLAAGACQEPTQVELRLSTDLPCDGVHGTAITVGRRGELEDAFPAASLAICEPGADGTQHLGLVVLVPRDGASDDAIALKVVAALTARSVDDCKPADGTARGYQGCVVARRELRYRPGQTLRLAVPLLRQCEGVECTVDSTCFDATNCMPAGVTCSEETCTIDDAPERHFVNPSGPGAAAGGTAGAGGGGAAGAGGPAGAGGEAGAGGAAGAGGGAGGAAGASGAAGEGGTAGGVGKPFVSQIVAGTSHSCALVQNGEVRCWGYNGFGQLGDGTTTNRLSPVPVLKSPGGPALTGVQALTLNGHHSCALVSGGEVRCWGDNGYGQLGDGTTTQRLSPVPVLQSPGGLPLTGVQALALGGWHNCALLNGGEVRCWGSNTVGQQGDGTTTDHLTPVPVLESPGGPPLTGMQAIALGAAHSCAWVRGGEVRCWGWNDFGQLGDGTITQRLSPVPVLQSPGGLPLTGVQAIVLGGEHSCALLSGGEVHCWGRNEYGQLGDGTTEDWLTPVPVLQSPGGPRLTGVQAPELGLFHSCALVNGSEVRCWGRNDSGQLGDGTTEGRLTPVPVLLSPGLTPMIGVQPLALGGWHSCALVSEGEVQCWGQNLDGQLGDGTVTNQPSPVPVLFESGAASPLLTRSWTRPISTEPPLHWLLSPTNRTQ